MLSNYYLEFAKKQQENAINGRGDCSWDSHASLETNKFRDFCDHKNKDGESQVKYDDRADLVHNSTEWSQVISALQSYIDSIPENEEEEED